MLRKLPANAQKRNSHPQSAGESGQPGRRAPQLQQRRPAERGGLLVLGEQARRDRHGVPGRLGREALAAPRPRERELEALAAPGLGVVRGARAQVGLQPRHEQRPPGRARHDYLCIGLGLG
jgi:hypothetical protein